MSIKSLIKIKNLDLISKIKTGVFLLAYLFVYLPLLAYGQETPYDFQGFANLIIGLIDLAIPAVTGLIFVVFLWGAGLFILNGDNQEKRDQGKRLLFWGIIGLFMTLSVWGIVAILTGTLGLSFGAPQLRTQ